MKRTQHILPFCLLLLLFAACNPLRKLPAGHFLLNKNIISISDTVEVEREELYSLLKQKPNRKILWVLRFHQGLYNIGNAGDTTVANHKGIGKIFGGLKRGLRTIGEPPVLLDSFLTEKSRQQIELYLQKKGYFNASVKDSISVSRKNIFSSLFHRNRKGENDSLQVSKSRKAEVYYNVNSGSPYKIRSFQYSS